MTRLTPALVPICLLSVLLAACAGKTSSPLEPDQPVAVSADAKPVLIDTDLAPDDWLAILYLFNRPDVDVQAITVTGTGEAHCSAGTRNALDLAALAGRSEMPVACGRETPLVGEHAFPDQWRENVDDLLGLTLPESPKAVADESAVEMLTRLIRTSPRKVHLLALGPLTNIGEALLADPTLVDNVEMITIMGGAVEVPGNVGPSSGIDNTSAEWNIYVDPRAANVVLESGAPITLVPLDAANDVPMTVEFVDRLKDDRTTASAEFVHGVLKALEEDIRSGRRSFWDPLAAAVVSDEDLVAVQEMLLTVVEEEGPESGRTLEADTGSRVGVATAADRERFEKEYLDTVNRLLP